MSVDPAAIGNLRLTDRTILVLVVERLANKEIAWQLHCDVRYVQNRLHVVYKQIGALNRVDAALAHLKRLADHRLIEWPRRHLLFMVSAVDAMSMAIFAFESGRLLSPQVRAVRNSKDT